MNLLRLTVLIAIILHGFVPKESLAQSDEPTPGIRHVFHADFGIVGYGGVLTVNFETRLWTNNKAIQLRARTGFGYFAAAYLSDSREIKGVPLNLTALFGEKKHFFEITIGGIIGTETIKNRDSISNSIGIWPLIDVGYRFERAPRGIILRVKIGTGGLGAGIGFGF